MFRLVYVSTATTLFNREQLVELLAKSRENNARAGITGLLLYKEGSFIQLLEGEESAVRALYKTISEDSRHQGAIKLIEEACDDRLFQDWSMGFRDLSDPEVQNMPGYSEFMNSAMLADDFTQDASEVLSVLSAFKPTF